MSDRRLSIRVSKALRKQLAALVEKTGQTESAIVREALTKYYHKEFPGPSAYEYFKAAGMIGDVDGLPSDYSTNPKYMEEFGRD